MSVNNSASPVARPVSLPPLDTMPLVDFIKKPRVPQPRPRLIKTELMTPAATKAKPEKQLIAPPVDKSASQGLEVVPAVQRKLEPVPPVTARAKRPLARFAQADEGPNFYMSLSDLMCLLVVFFVLIFSLSGSELREQIAKLSQLNEQQKPLPVFAVAPAQAADPFPAPQPMSANLEDSLRSLAGLGQSDPAIVKEQQKNLADLTLTSLLGAGQTAAMDVEPQGNGRENAIVAQVKSELRLPGTEVENRADRVVVRLPESITFALGQADIKPQAVDALARLADMLRARPSSEIIITGHTDDLPIKTPMFASNWELSGARAAAVARALMDKGIEQSRFTIRGLADQSPRVSNDTMENRQQNRRVEIELTNLS